MATKEGVWMGSRIDGWGVLRSFPCAPPPIPDFRQVLPMLADVALVLHQLVLINYGESATPDDAETFGSLALGLSKEDYYRALCELSSQIGGDELV